MSRRVALLAALAAAAIAPTPLGRGSPDPPPESHRWICGVVRDWKALMRERYPTHDRSVPDVARRCQMPDD